MKKLLICCLGFILIQHLHAQELLPQADTPSAQVRADDADHKRKVTEAMPQYAVKGSAPTFPGGEMGLTRFIQEHLEYPELASSHAHEGTVIVEYVIAEDGRVGQAKILKGIGMGCDAAALAVFTEMPRWKPAVHRGRSVSVKCITPVKFRLY